MSRFDIRTVVIHAPWWEENETVTLRELSYAEQRAIHKRIFAGQKIATNKHGEMSMDSSASSRMQEEILRAHLASWTFTDNTGAAVPVTPENIGRLPARDADYILEEIDRLTPSRDDQFPGGSGDGSANGEG